MKILILTCISTLWLNTIFAQSYQTDLESQSEIMKMEFLIGNWEGKGWRMLPDGTKHSFDQSENVQFKLDSTAVLIEGKGFAGDQVIHNALAVVTYNKESRDYSFQSYLQNGMKGSFKASIQGKELTWFPNDNTRYIIKLTEDGAWHEIGEYNREGNWMQFFEMTLSKK